MSWLKLSTLGKVLLFCCILTFIFLSVYLAHVARIDITSRPLLDDNCKINSSQSITGPAFTENPITLFVRMSGSLPDHRFRYYCHLFRTLVLYWPPSFGKIAIVLDEEGKEDHKFAAKVRRENKRYFPDYKIAIAFEAPPKNNSTLTGKVHREGYIRQLSGAPNDRFLGDDLKWLVMHPGVL